MNAGMYRLWQQLAVTEGLPDEALPAVIAALCTPSQVFYGVDNRGEEWRKKALAKALPVLLPRATEPTLRGPLLQQADDTQLAELAGLGVVTAADLPAILADRRPTPELVVGLARHPDQVDAAIGLLAFFQDTDLEDVLSAWNRHRYRSDSEPVPPLPSALLDAVLEQALTPFARLLQNPGRHEGWDICAHPELGLPHDFGEGAPWRILHACPDQWPDLAEHPVLGSAVQHLLLDHAEVEARRSRASATGSSLARSGEDEPADEPEPAPTLSADLLGACLPALCLPEMADLPKPSVSARHRLHRVADRVRSNPRLLTIAGEQLHTVADECVRRGRLLALPRKQDDAPAHKSLTVAQDLALLSTNSQHLAKACSLLAGLEQPTVVTSPPGAQLARITAGTDLLSPVRLLESRCQHQRAAVLVALAANPHTPRIAVTEALPRLHPLELAWICAQPDKIPDWLGAAAAALTPADASEAVLRLVTDEELDRHLDPGAVLQSWLDTPETDGPWSRHSIYRAILGSSHHTLDHLRQLPADEVLTCNDPDLALPYLLAGCGARPESWNALLKALDYGPADEKISFGQLLDILRAPSPASTAR
ncbi:hypothetical protein [Streptomyces graminilatus]|uniref:hypothetical protein n=1 Tax=Streptomyces graminilatus TaxID=1464070 RepID=UPI000ADCF68E|nr:hypothetical protein [Streptomyces graminilatus]